MSPAPSSRRRPGGFPLLEVVISMVIIGIISGTVFAIVSGSVRASVEIQKVQRERDQINRFLDLCRQTFQSLPNSATLSLKLAETTGVGGPQELTITGMPTCFAVGALPVSMQATTLGMQPMLEDGKQLMSDNGSPLYELGITRRDILPPTADGQIGATPGNDTIHTPDAAGRYWLPLIKRISTLKWRFWNEKNDEWLEEWRSSTLPDLVEINLAQDGRLVPVRLAFSMPFKTLREGSGQPAQPTTGKPPPVTSTKGSPPPPPTSGGGGR